MKYFNIFILSLLFLTISACEKDKEKLTHAKPYQVVNEYEITLNNDSRVANLWFITSDASDFDEFAQTAILAAMDLHKQYNSYDLIHVLLVPDKDLVATGSYYASAFYAVDKKGLKHVSGADQQTMTNFKWLVRATENSLTQKELEITKLWYKHMADFPSEDMLSSLSYNEEKLVIFVADSLNLNIEEVVVPQFLYLDYKELHFFYYLT